MQRFALLLALALSSVASTAYADASKDALVTGAVLHGEIKVQKDDKTRLPPVKDEPSASKTSPLVRLPAAKLK
jgi:hypothetical protein